MPEKPLPVNTPPPPKPQEKVEVDDSEAMPDEGRQHESIKRRIMQEAEVLGYGVEWERLVLNGKGRVDLVLTRGTLTIACEVSVTTTIEHEVQNVLKCVQAGFQRIAVVCMSRKRLKALEEAIKGCLDGTGVECSFYVPSELLARLQDWAKPCDKSAEGDRSTRRRVNLFSGDLSDNQRREREKQLLAELAQRMRQPRAGL